MQLYQASREGIRFENVMATLEDEMLIWRGCSSKLRIYQTDYRTF